MPQAPFVTVHRKVLLDGMDKPVRLEFGSVALESVAVPLTTVHNPVPIVGEFAESAAVAELQSVWSPPAMTVVGTVSTVSSTSSLEMAHTPLLILHSKVTLDAVELDGMINPDTDVVGTVVLPIMATPLTTVQLPVPTDGALPESVAVLTLHNDWSTPALAVVGRVSI